MDRCRDLVTAFDGCSKQSIAEALPLLVTTAIDRPTFAHMWVLFVYIRCLERRHRVFYRRWSLYCACLVLKHLFWPYKLSRGREAS